MERIIRARDWAFCATYCAGVVMASSISAQAPADNWVVNAEWLMAQRHYRQAYDVASRERESRPNNATACAYCGLARMFMGFPVDARTHLNRAVELNPKGIVENSIMAIHLRSTDDPTTIAFLKAMQEAADSRTGLGELEIAWLLRSAAILRQPLKPNQSGFMTNKFREFAERMKSPTKSSSPMNGVWPKLPIGIGYDRHWALVDTGATATFLDASLLPTLPQISNVARVLFEGSRVPAGEFRAPQLLIAGRNMPRSENIYLMELEPIRRGAGSDCYALLGLDQLKYMRFALDFDKRETIVLDSPPNPDDWEFSQPLRLDANGVHLQVEVDGKQEQFLIDTGAKLSGGIRRKKSMGGDAWLPSLKLRVGANLVNGVYLSPGRNQFLGLGFLSRFRLCFDMPGKKLYFSRGRDFHSTDPSNHYGMRLKVTAEGLKVAGTQKTDIAASVGVKEGDVIIAINERKGNAVVLYNLLTDIGKKTLHLRRGSDEFSVEIR